MNTKLARIGQDQVESETAVEVGLVLFAALLLGGLVFLLGGRAVGDAKRGRRYKAASPGPGTLPPDRHGNTPTAAAR